MTKYFKMKIFFSNDDWLKLFHNVVDSISLTNMEDFYSINQDIETFCLYYYLGTKPDKLAELYSNKLNTHWCWLTSCGLINLGTYSLSIDTKMKSLEIFSKYQLGINKSWWSWDHQLLFLCAYLYAKLNEECKKL